MGKPLPFFWTTRFSSVFFLSPFVIKENRREISDKFFYGPDALPVTQPTVLSIEQTAD